MFTDIARNTTVSIIRDAPKIPTWYRRFSRLAQLQKDFQQVRVL